MNMMILMLKLLLTYINELNFCDVFPNNSATNVKLLKTKISKSMHSGGNLVRLFWPLLKIVLLLAKKVKSVSTIRTNNITRKR